MSSVLLEPEEYPERKIGRRLRCLSCLSVSLSCLLLHSYTVYTPEKRGTKEKSSTPAPKVSPNIFRSWFPPHARPPPSSLLLSGSILLARTRRGPAAGSSHGRHQGLPPVRGLCECHGASVYLLSSRHEQSDEEHINGGPI
ncbi:hypothetical protein EYF80_003823 [Liparis tanakae]|uniref:Uncharacterized protein n=1 Tax=Liparis tanakae TaxID=230148 RepID=A0A4Z2J712_9TELE|nr:hypothetical protein EYF80_003823 [Liparis tanakae]